MADPMLGIISVDGRIQIAHHVVLSAGSGEAPRPAHYRRTEEQYVLYLGSNRYEMRQPECCRQCVCLGGIQIRRLI